jgi:hypothetical protein
LRIALTLLRKDLANLSKQFAVGECSEEFAGDTPAATIKPLRAVSSVVEHLVYTEFYRVFAILVVFLGDRHKTDGR